MAEIKKQKILYVITKSSWGGAQRYVYDMATNLGNGYEPVVAFGGSGLLAERLAGKKVRVVSISRLSRDVGVADIPTFFSLYQLFRREKPNVVHLNSSKAGGLGALAARLARVPRIVFTAHGWPFFENRPAWQRFLIKFASWLMVIFAHTVITLCEQDLHAFDRCPFTKGKIVKIYNGVRDTDFLDRETARKELSKIAGYNLFDISNKFVIGTIAELHPNKGLVYLINAVAEVRKTHPELVCIIIGDGQERTALESLIKEKQLGRVVFLTGYMDGASRYLKAFNIFVLPSLKEGLPYVLLEAGLASLPVIATSVGGVPEIIENKKSGLLVQPKNPVELADAISFLVAREKERGAYGAALHAHVKSQFSFDKMLSETEKLYSKK